MPEWLEALFLVPFLIGFGIVLRVLIDWLSRDQVSVYLERDALRRLKAELQARRQEPPPAEAFELALSHLRTYLEEQLSMPKVTGLYLSSSDFHSNDEITATVEIDTPAPAPFGTTINLSWAQGSDPPTPIHSQQAGSWLPAALESVHIPAGQTEGTATGTLGQSPGQGTAGTVAAQDDNAQFLWAD